jgi:hypothetical protein
MGPPVFAVTYNTGLSNDVVGRAGLLTAAACRHFGSSNVSCSVQIVHRRKPSVSDQLLSRISLAPRDRAEAPQLLLGRGVKNSSRDASRTPALGAFEQKIGTPEQKIGAEDQAGRGLSRHNAPETIKAPTWWLGQAAGAKGRFAMTVTHRARVLLLIGASILALASSVLLLNRRSPLIVLTAAPHSSAPRPARRTARSEMGKPPPARRHAIATAMIEMV